MMRKIYPHALTVLTVLLAALFLPFARPVSAQGNQPAVGPREIRSVPGQIVLKAPVGMAEAEVQRLADGVNCRVLGPIAYSPRYYLLEIKTRQAATRAVATPTPPTQDVNDAVAKLRATPGVLADPNFVAFKTQTATDSFTPDDPLYPQQWNMRMIRMPEAWAVQVGARPSLVAVIDTGLDTTHPDFVRADKTLVYRDPMNFADPLVPTGDVTDIDGHGTHVSGTATAAVNNATGIAGVAGSSNGGVAVTLLPIKAAMFDPDTGSSFSAASVVAGLSYAAAKGVELQMPVVVNMSIAFFASPTTLESKVAEVIAQNVVVVAAMGNFQFDHATFPIYPAEYPGVIAVASVGPDSQLAYYSDFGGNVTIAAPGGDFLDGPDADSLILSTVPPGVDPDGNGYDYYQGTSMASPHVAGAVGLLLAAGAEPNEIRSAIQSTAKRLADDTPNNNGGNKYGAGLLDVYEALLPYIGPRVRILSPAEQSTTLYQTLTVTLQVRNVQKLKDDPDATLTVIIRTATTPSTIVRRIPIDKSSIPLPPPGSSPATPVVITIPNISLPPERYIIEARLDNVLRPNQDVAFLTVVSRTQPVGKSLFAVPFLVPDASGGPEAALFGGAPFVLQRWNPFKDGGAGDYAKYFSTGTPQEGAARFRMTQADLDSSLPALPITFDATLPPGQRTSIAPIGLGFWLDIGSDITLSLSGSTISNPVAIELFAEGGGWNQVGAPYVFPVDWNAASVLYQGQTLSLQQAIENNVIKSVLVGYRDGDYVFSIAPLGQFVPFNGYWVKALQRCTLLVPPTPTSEQSVTRAAAPTAVNAPSAGGGWRVRLSASVAGDRDGQNFFGQMQGAQKEDDRFDVPKPPSGGGHAYVRFVQRETRTGRANALAFDMRPAGSGREEWTLAVTTDRPNAEVVLSWDGLGAAPRRSRFTLTDTVTGQKVLMRARSAYKYRSGEAGATRLLMVATEPEASSGPMAIMNLQVVSNPGGRAAAARGVTVRFSTSREADVSGVIKTLGGKTVAHLNGAGRSVASGQSTLHWDGRGSEGAALPAGPYLVEITAHSGTDTAREQRPVMLVR